MFVGGAFQCTLERRVWTIAAVTTVDCDSSGSSSDSSNSSRSSPAAVAAEATVAGLGSNRSGQFELPIQAATDLFLGLEALSEWGCQDEFFGTGARKEVEKIRSLVALCSKVR